MSVLKHWGESSPKPWQEKVNSSRGAPMGRDGADPRAVWPWGVLDMAQAVENVSEARRDLRRAQDADRHNRRFADFTASAPYWKSKLAEAQAILAAVSDPHPGTLTIHRVPIDDGGYDEGGAYWGLGEPLYCAMTADRAWVFFARAPDAASAMVVFRDSNADVPKARWQWKGGD